jgi:type III secretion protein V
LQRRLSALLGPEQEAAYLERLVPGKERLPLRTLLPALSHVLDLWISIADTEIVVSTLRAAVNRGRTCEEAGEDLIAALRPNVVEIGMSRSYLRALTLSDQGEHSGFNLLRSGLFYELGVSYPPFRFVIDETVKPFGFWVKVNHWITVPVAGLLPGEYLVNDTVDRLTLVNIRGRKAINPANGVACAVIDSRFKEAAEAVGLTTWSPMDYLVLSCAAVLRQRSSCFMDLKVAGSQLEALASAFPALVQVTRAKYTDPQIAQVLRNLLLEEISIQNLRLILEGLLDFDSVVIDAANLIILDDRLPIDRQPDPARARDAVELTAFVRMQMKRYLSNKYTKGASTLVVYLLDPDIEKMLAASGSDLAADRREELAGAFRAEIGNLPSTAAAPAVLTTTGVRQALRELIADEFPRVPVLCYQELSSDLNIQPVARISLRTSAAH